MYCNLIEMKFFEILIFLTPQARTKANFRHERKFQQQYFIM